MSLADKETDGRLVVLAEITDGQIYTFKNVNSGLFLEIADGNAENGANLQQSSSNGKQNQFMAVSAGNGYYYLVSQLGDGKSYALDVNAKKTADGIWSDDFTKELLESKLDHYRKRTNELLPRFAALSAFELRDTEFEKTPKRSIRRYLYK